jgi:hypothetical protein
MHLKYMLLYFELLVQGDEPNSVKLLFERWVDEIVNGESVTKTLSEQPEETKHHTPRTT